MNEEHALIAAYVNRLQSSPWWEKCRVAAGSGGNQGGSKEESSEHKFANSLKPECKAYISGFRWSNDYWLKWYSYLVSFLKCLWHVYPLDLILETDSRPYRTSSLKQFIFHLLDFAIAAVVYVGVLCFSTAGCRVTTFSAATGCVAEQNALYGVASYSYRLTFFTCSCSQETCDTFILCVDIWQEKIITGSKEWKEFWGIYSKWSLMFLSKLLISCSLSLSLSLCH